MKKPNQTLQTNHINKKRGSPALYKGCKAKHAERKAIFSVLDVLLECRFYPFITTSFSHSLTKIAWVAFLYVLEVCSSATFK